MATISSFERSKREIPRVAAPPQQQERRQLPVGQRRRGYDALIAGGLLYVCAALGGIAGYLFIQYGGTPSADRAVTLLVGFVITSVVIGVGAFGFLDAREARERKNRIDRIIDEVQNFPEKAKPAWDLASAKLEDYLARNLSQVRSIYYLVVLVMAVGFGFIGWGVYNVFSGANLEASLVAAVSGIFVQFIGATFLLVYRSTMEQAKDYVAMLERINAVGMSVQLVETIEDSDPKARDKVRAELASSLLNMYGKSQKA